MAPDYHTLLLAIGLSGFCLAGTLFASWLSSRLERFLLSWAIGIGLTVPAVAVYNAYVTRPDVLLGCLCFALQLASFSFIYGAAWRFRTGRPGRYRILAAFAVSTAFTLPFMVAGYSGLGFIAFNVLLAALLAMTAWEYWRSRAEAPLPLTGISLLYVLTTISFLLCALVLIHDGAWVLEGAPDNWAEDLNLIVAIVGITGIGAMSLALNQWRVAASNRREAMTDALTGLLNRRALFDRYGEKGVEAHAAVIAFDLDHFKAVNDRHGHAVGDAVLCAFARVMTGHAPAAAVAARLGGEEFALVLERVAPDRAMLLAELIRTDFSMQTIPADGDAVSCTVSAGVAFAEHERFSFDVLLNAADKALYLSKQEGRNRISQARERLRIA
ncbi:GGDEF domain-containing protein [Shinella daejeonensis]|uniref:GGDEF domain-containing protein n=1 Tax=Shinella daejeonensis TaxID=659017 RepID=UPI0020C7500A|nr:GGDEF domain-containing protein [Shinella daejeonensis]MCP8895641.1 GGDEF domain-containing protein [Shinella daejeonensis]